MNRKFKITAYLKLIFILFFVIMYNLIDLKPLNGIYIQDVFKKEGAFSQNEA